MDFPADPPPPSSSLRAAAAVAQEALTALVRQTLADIAHDPRTPPDGRLTLEWNSTMTAADLAEQALHRVQVMAGAGRIVQPGRVFCYHCGRADCEHALPAEPGQVFAGYGGTGRPRWEEFFNELSALGDDRVDLLFARPPKLLARVVGRRRLIAEQTLAYGRDSMTYRILGQLIAGYIPVGDDRCALTVQLVETADRELHVQALMAPRLQEALADAKPGRQTTCCRVGDAIAKLRRSVAGLSPDWRGKPTAEARQQLLARLFTMLRRLAATIEQKGRQAERRTAHAEQRHEQQRPVHKAADDVANASDQDFYRDTVRISNVVAGRGGRVHVFADDGRHITTLQLTSDKFDRRVRTHRYLPFAPEAIDPFRHAVLNQVKAEASRRASPLELP